MADEEKKEQEMNEETKEEKKTEEPGVGFNIRVFRTRPPDVKIDGKPDLAELLLLKEVVTRLVDDIIGTYMPSSTEMAIADLIHSFDALGKAVVAGAFGGSPPNMKEHH